MSLSLTDGTPVGSRLSDFYQLAEAPDHGKIRRFVMMRSSIIVIDIVQGEGPRMLWLSLIVLMLLIAASPGVMLYFEHRQDGADHLSPRSDTSRYPGDIV